MRYAFEFEGGHIKSAENWQHGEDDKFLGAFLPDTPLSQAPQVDVNNPVKRDILVFHCEFSSQRGPDFLNKLRERYLMMQQFCSIFQIKHFSVKNMALFQRGDPRKNSCARNARTRTHRISF